MADAKPAMITGKTWMAWFARVNPAASLAVTPNKESAKTPPASQSPHQPGTDGKEIKKQTITITVVISRYVRFTPGLPSENK